MRGAASRIVGGATPTQRGMALSHGVEGAASCSVGGAVTHWADRSCSRHEGGAMSTSCGTGFFLD